MSFIQFFFFKQKTAYEMRISDWSSDVCSSDLPLNIVMIVEESLGAQYVGNLGGSGLTPCLDSLAREGWNFTQAYATGTRSVRGLEALAAGFPPTIDRKSVV